MILIGDVRERLKELPDQSVNCCVTSPPYFGLRDYGTASWEGGDSSCDHSTARSRGDDIKTGDKQGTSAGSQPNTQRTCATCGAVRIDNQIGLEPTPQEFVDSLVAVFREVKRVLRDDGTLWVNMGDSYNGSGGNHQPHHKNDTGFQGKIGAEKFKEPSRGLGKTNSRFGGNKYGDESDPKLRTYSGDKYTDTGIRNKRDVWTVPTRSYKGAHFATFPPDLIQPCILAGCPEGGTVLDPFFGAGTTGLVAQRHNRKWIGCELNPTYAELAQNRINDEANLFTETT